MVLFLVFGMLMAGGVAASIDNASQVKRPDRDAEFVMKYKNSQRCWDGRTTVLDKTLVYTRCFQPVEINK